MNACIIDAVLYIYYMLELKTMWFTIIRATQQQAWGLFFSVCVMLTRYLIESLLWIWTDVIDSVVAISHECITTIACFLNWSTVFSKLVIKGRVCQSLYSCIENICGNLKYISVKFNDRWKELQYGKSHECHLKQNHTFQSHIASDLKKSLKNYMIESKFIHWN